MRSRLSLVFPLLLVATAARAQLRFFPAYPDSHTAVRAAWSAAVCGPDIPKVTVSGSSIEIHVDVVPVVACIATLPIVQTEVALGVLPAGTYDVRTSGEGVPPLEATLVVRGVDPFRVTPPGAPLTGGGEVMLVHDDNVYEYAAAPPYSVEFGGVPAQSVRLGQYGLMVVPPPHAAGLVDVTWRSAQGRSETARSSFRYYDPSEGADPFVFERVLFPVAFEGAGAYGSQWTTDNSAYGHEVVLADGSKRNGVVLLPKVSQADGSSLFVGRGAYRDLSFSSRIRDLSRQAESAGTAVPVVRENDFRTSMAFYDIPHGPNYRVTLRVWTTEDGGYPDAKRVSPDGLPFVIKDVTATLSPDQPLVVTSFRGQLFALLTVTNNVTQQVTVMTPR